MKRMIINSLLALVACTAFAQVPTVKVTDASGLVYNYNWSMLGEILFTPNNGLKIMDGDGWSVLAEFSNNSVNTIEFDDGWSNPTLLVNQVYGSLYEASENPHTGFHFISMVASDDMLGGGGANDLAMTATDLMANSGTNMTLPFWEARYRGINMANQALAILPQFECSEADRNQAMGEVYFLRAFYYYELASMYGNIPLLTDNSVVTSPAQATPAETWGRILLDLKTAISLMKNQRVINVDDKDTTDPFHVDKYAAEGMLARAWLFYTGYYLGANDAANSNPSVQLPDGSVMTKQQVVDYLKDCVQNSGYQLVPDYRNLWAYTNRYTAPDYPYTAGKGLQWVESDGNINPEALFSIKYNKLASWGTNVDYYSQASYATTIGYSNMYALFFGVRDWSNGYPIFPFGQGWGAGTVVPSLYTDWNTSDMRRDASIEHALYVTGDAVQLTGYINKKLIAITARNGSEYYSSFCDPMFGGTYWDNYGNFQLSNIQNLVLLRYADVLLMLSELTGDASYMNQVRARVGLPAVSYSLANIQQERRAELAFEGVRWNDMRRWGKDYCVAALNAQIGQPCYNQGSLTTNEALLGGYGARYEATGGFFKIPEQEMILNPSLVQNPGWDSDCEFTGWGGNTPDPEPTNPLTRAEIMDMLNSGAVKSWTWDTEYFDDGSVWGNMGYRGVESTDPTERLGSKWWGCSPEDLLSQLEVNSDTGVATGEESRNAYMTFGTDGSIHKYAAGGSELVSGTYDVNVATYDNNWKFGDLTTTAGTILWPFKINGGGYKPSSFEILNITDNNLVLVYADPDTGSWMEATWWVFKKK